MPSLDQRKHSRLKQMPLAAAAGLGPCQVEPVETALAGPVEFGEGTIAERQLGFELLGVTASLPRQQLSYDV